MINQLEKIGIRRIAIVDDLIENINAAKELEKKLPNTEFEFYQRGDLLVAQIPDRIQGT